MIKKMTFSSVLPELRDIMKDVGQEADFYHLPIYLVGGIVRDAVLKIKSLDLDFVIEGDALKFAQGYAVKQYASLTIYPQFKTATVFMPGGLQVDFATARQETYPKAGVLPVVRAGNIEDDLRRRDFSINAIAANINVKDFGQVVDVVGGLKDLKSKKIRVLHKQSFQDDPTRILRAIRFSTRLNFAIEPATLKLLKTALRKKMDLCVKPQRYFEEFSKFFAENDPQKPIAKLYELGGLRISGQKINLDIRKFKVLHKQFKIFQKMEWLKKVDLKMMQMLIFFDSLKGQLKPAMIQKLGLTKQEEGYIRALPQISGVIKQLSKKKLTNFQIYNICKQQGSVIICFLQLKAPNKVAKKRIVLYWKKLRNVVLFVNGNDFLRMGVMDGKKIGVYLEEVLKEKMNRGFRSQQDEFDYAKSLLK